MINGVGRFGSVEPTRIAPERGLQVSKPGDATAEASGGAPATLVGKLTAEGPPVDAAKVAAIRAAIARGAYPVDPDKIAERMLALDLPVRA